MNIPGVDLLAMCDGDAEAVNLPAADGKSAEVVGPVKIRIRYHKNIKNYFKQNI